jgi:hypothetical protein
MGWEQRGGRSYYYRKERESSRVRSIYVGGGETAAFISQLEKGRREEDEMKREDRRRELAKLEQQDATIEAACRMIDMVIEAALIAAGFHIHKRQWRKQRYVDDGGEGNGEANG